MEYMEKIQITNYEINKVSNFIRKNEPSCYGFAWQGFGSGGTIGVASVRIC